jgi:2-methylisocitrate lyase-like PEP mutase family enzyme
MARTFPFQVNGTAYNMPTNYKASREIADKVGDPLRMAMDSAAGKLAWTQEDVISIIHIGVSNAGCSLERDQVAEHVIEQGLLQSYKAAADYISALVAGGPERPVTGGASKKSRPGTK